MECGEKTCMSAGGRSGPSGKKKVNYYCECQQEVDRVLGGIKENKIITAHVGGRSIGS